jgi:hypothetical protein
VSEVISFQGHEFEKDTSRFGLSIRDVGRLKCRLCRISVKYSLRKGWPDKRMNELRLQGVCSPKTEEPTPSDVSLLNE